MNKFTRIVVGSVMSVICLVVLTENFSSKNFYEKKEELAEKTKTENARKLAEHNSLTPEEKFRRNYPEIKEGYPEFSSLPAHYQGQLLSKVWWEISDLASKKGTYETTAEYEDKQKRILKDNAPLLEGYIPLTGSSSFPHYDADKKILSVEYSIDSVSQGESRDGGSYIGSNAFGVSNVVKKTTRSVYEMKFQVKKGGKTSRKVNIHVPPDIAKKHALDLVNILYIAQLVPPYSTSGLLGEVTRDEPTLDDPEDVENTYYEATGALRGVVLYYEKTGEIIYQERFSEK